ncbi:thiamine pyrophosphate-binding protein [Virgibacillus sp. W0430]|uniref:thiamine pyrophosphate-binding protein n=1 Tax=Virgibacillus sp. W0430 TaxID=3391580 RepID=UPI003F4877FF
MTKVMKTLTAAQAIIECLKKENVERVFCVPGESYLPVLDAFHDTPEIQVISARHEGGAAFMAEGYAKASLKPGVVMATRGVGAANLTIGVHTAYQDSTPMIVFLGQVHSKFRGREGFQEVDLDRFFQPITKWAVEVKDAERMPEIVEKAFRIAQTGRPGPVVISLPEDVLPKRADMYFGPRTMIPRPAPSTEEIKLVSSLLKESSRPLIIAGGGVKLAQAESLLQQFAEKNSLPVMAAFRRQDVFPNDHHLYTGHLGLGTNKNVLETVKEADVIIALGTRLSEVTTQDYSIITPDKKLIHIDIDYETIGKTVAPEIGIVADSKEALKHLNDLDIKETWKDWAKEKRNVFEKASTLTLDSTAVINKHVISILKEKLPENALITNDAGNFASWLHTYYSFTQEHTYVGPTSGAMGYGLPAALGAQLAKQDKTVVALSGDGGFMMTANELETAVRYNIPVISLVFNNNMYGTIRMHQEMHYPEKVVATDLGTVSFVQLAQSMGADGYLVRTAAEFSTALETALEKSVPAMIEILTEKEQIAAGSTIEQIRKNAMNNTSRRKKE